MAVLDRWRRRFSGRLNVCFALISCRTGVSYREKVAGPLLPFIVNWVCTRESRYILNKLSVIVGLSALSMPFAKASASYWMFCELDGTIVSIEESSDLAKVEVRVQQTREVELDGVGSGEPDCHQFLGKTISVVLDRTKDHIQNDFSEGDRILLERYEIDAIDKATGASVRNIRHVVKGI